MNMKSVGKLVFICKEKEKILLSNNIKNILIVGGDNRFITICKRIKPHHNLFVCGIDPIYTEDIGCINVSSPREITKPIDIIILPVIVSIDDIHVSTALSQKVITVTSVLDKAHENTLVFGGNFSPLLLNLLKERKIRYFDYMKREELLLSNAYLTAQGAVATMINNINFSLCRARVLIIGSGRIAKILVNMLKGFSCSITATARKKSDLILQEISGVNAVATDKIGEVLSSQDIIINTVPALILTEPLLHLVNKNALIIDLASKPGGVDFMMANELNLRCLWELGIPGKMADAAAGSIVYDTINNILVERGETIE